MDQEGGGINREYEERGGLVAYGVWREGCGGQGEGGEEIRIFCGGRVGDWVRENCSMSFLNLFFVLVICLTMTIWISCARCFSTLNIQC